MLAKKHFSVLASELPNFLYVPCYCLYHKYSLGCESLLLVVDSYVKTGCSFKCGYYNGLCQLVNVWRADAAAVFKSWRHLFGNLSAVTHAIKLCPRAISAVAAALDVLCSKKKWISV